MTRLTSVIVTLAAAFAWTWMSSPSLAVLIEVNGTAVFYDTFEGDVLGSTPGPTNPGPGTWSTNSDNSTSETTQNVAPGPIEGSTYLRLQRGGDPSDLISFAEGWTASNNDVVHVEWMMYVPTGTDDLGITGGQLSSGGTRFALWAVGSGVVKTHDINSGNWEATTLPFQYDTWQKWEQDWVVGAGTQTISVDGISVVADGVNNNTSDPVIFHRFVAGPGNEYFVDAVPIPEPGCAALLAFGMIGLMLPRLRRRG